MKIVFFSLQIVHICSNVWVGNHMIMDLQSENEKKKQKSITTIGSEKHAIRVR